MLRILITYFWPVLLPLVLFTLWYINGKQTGHEKEVFFSWLIKKGFILVTSMLGVAIVCFLFLLWNNVTHKVTDYQPARYENGTLIPPQVK